MQNEVEFTAEFVEAESVEYTSDYTVIGIYFGEGDPENGGEHWNFTQSIGDDENEGICTVKEPQLVTTYGGIESFKIGPSGLVCIFGEEIISETKVKKLIINYVLNNEQWKQLSEMAQKVFKGEKYFELLH